MVFNIARTHCIPYHLNSLDYSKLHEYSTSYAIFKKILLNYSMVFRFSNTSLIGIAPELSPVYHHILYRYRYQNKETKLGMPFSEGGFPGVNSGVLVLHLDRLRASTAYEKLLSNDSLEAMTKKYSFKVVFQYF